MSIQTSPRINKTLMMRVLMVALFLFGILGVAYFASGVRNNYVSKAEVSDLQREIAANPNDHEARYFLAYRLMKEEKPKEALVVMEEAIRKDPTRARNWEGYARCAAMNGLARKSVEGYEKAFELNPTAVSASSIAHVYAEAGLLTPALEWFDKSVKIDPNVDLNSEDYAKCLIAFERYQDAWEVLMKSINTVPVQDTIYLLLAETAVKVNKTDMATHLLGRRMSMTQGYPLGVFQRTMALMELAMPRTPARLEEARKWSEAAAYDRSKDPANFGLLAEILILQKKDDEALVAARKGLAINPQNPECLKVMVKILEKAKDTKQKEYYENQYYAATKLDRKLESLEAAVAKNPKDEGLRLQYIGALERSAKFGEAAEECLRILEANPAQKAAEAGYKKNKEAAIVKIEKSAAERIKNEQIFSGHDSHSDGGHGSHSH